MRGSIGRLVPFALAGVAVLLGACGIPLSGAVSLPAQQIPSGLEQSTPSSTSTTVASSNVVAIPIYFLNAAGDRLVKTVANEQGATTPQQAAAEALGILTYGPTASDSRAYGLQTAWPASPQPTPSVKIDAKNGIATVLLDPILEGLFGTTEYAADAQIVYTLTNPRFGVHAVVFEYDGDAQPAYFPPANYTYRPVTRSDYASFAPLSTKKTSSTTTTTTLTTSRTTTSLSPSRRGAGSQR